MKLQHLLFMVLFLWTFVACKSTSKFTTLETPSFASNYMSKSVAAYYESNGVSKSIEFKKIQESVDSGQYIEVCKKWFDSNGLQLKAMSYHDGFEMQPMKHFSIASWIGKYNNHEAKGKKYWLSHAVEQDHAVLLFYGAAPNEFRVINNVTLLVIRSTRDESIVHEYDFENFVYAPDHSHKVKEFVFQDLLWAHLDADVLYVSNAHWTYAESSRGQNAYISAISLSNHKLLWRSAELVSNAINFVTLEDYIISAYGYTREGAKLYAIDKKTGKTIGNIELSDPRSGKKHIEYVFYKSGTVYAKAFDGTQYKVSVQTK